MTKRIIFFCGHKSLYGLEHFLPLANSRFKIIGIVIASEKRWKIFRECLNGIDYINENRYAASFSYRFKERIKQTIPEWLIRSLRTSYRKPPNLKKYARSNDIPYFEVYDVNDDSFISQIAHLHPNFIISAAYPQIFGGKLIHTPSIGSINFHPSLLPKYRGAHPHFWVIVNGDSLGGMTAHYMTEDLDKGSIIAQISFPIGSDTYSKLYEKLIKNIPSLVQELDKNLHDPNFRASPQTDEDATMFRNDREIHRRIFWNIHDTETIVNLCRTEQAYCFFRNRKIICLDAYGQRSNRNLTNNISVQSGTIIDFDRDALSVKTRDGCIYIRFFEENGKRIGYPKWIKKHNALIGEMFS